MKSLNKMEFPDDLRYSRDHEWVRPCDDTMTVGISDYAQDQLGDIVFVELPYKGDSFNKGEEFGTVESVKAVSELYMPVGGEILSVNTALEDAPNLLNSNPYGDGWVIEVRPSDRSETDELMTQTDYMDMLKTDE